MITLILSKFHRSIDNSIDFYLFYFVVIRLLITTNVVMKIQNLIVNHESRSVESNREPYLLYSLFILYVDSVLGTDICRYMLQGHSQAREADNEIL